MAFSPSAFIGLYVNEIYGRSKRITKYHTIRDELAVMYDNYRWCGSEWESLLHRDTIKRAIEINGLARLGNMSDRFGVHSDKWVMPNPLDATSEVNDTATNRDLFDWICYWGKRNRKCHVLRDFSEYNTPILDGCGNDIIIDASKGGNVTIINDIINKVSDDKYYRIIVYILKESEHILLVNNSVRVMETLLSSRAIIIMVVVNLKV